MAKWELVKLIRTLTGDRKSLSVHVDNENPLEVQLKGSTVDLRGLAANRPAATSVSVGATYWSVDTGEVHVSDGTVWRVV